MKRRQRIRELHDRKYMSEVLEVGVRKEDPRIGEDEEYDDTEPQPERGIQRLHEVID